MNIPTAVTALAPGDIFAVRNGARYVVTATYADGERTVADRATGTFHTLPAHIEYRKTGARNNPTYRMPAAHPRTDVVARPVNVVGRTSV